ncbi:hypothetical protein [Paenibacillus piri]|uniref:Signal peptidase I n=1 Tax=Paenibacillus piri TaxID=2547395 RepID=A0A4R5KXI4_9BACL|nr:hypothetical protein [Paenibacillus piri]TDG00293.1 hypothetical protein E1757_01215 [Paenibacillus piri]
MQINAEALRQLMLNRGYLQIPSNGVSMIPLIRSRSICRFEPLVPDELQPGDIVLFVSHAGELVGHRFMAKTDVGGEVRYICKGDSNKLIDPPIAADRIIGRMVSIQGARHQIRTDHALMKLYAKLLVNVRPLSLCIHYGLRIARKCRRLMLALSRSSSN